MLNREQLHTEKWIYERNKARQKTPRMTKNISHLDEHTHVSTMGPTDVLTICYKSSHSRVHKTAPNPIPNPIPPAKNIIVHNISSLYYAFEKCVFSVWFWPRHHSVRNFFHIHVPQFKFKLELLALSQHFFSLHPEIGVTTPGVGMLLQDLCVFQH